LNYIILGSWWQAKGTAPSSTGFAASLALVKERSLFIACADFEDAVRPIESQEIARFRLRYRVHLNTLR
jgi:hypothetical protein